MEIGAGVTPGCCLFNGRQSRRRQCWRALFDDIVAIEVLGPMTLHFRLQQPNASLLACLATFPAWLISPGALRDHGEALQQIPVGTGPYRFVSWYPGETISLERPLRLSTFTAPRIYFPDPVRVASLIRDDLQRVGIPVEIVSRDFQSHLTAVRNGEHELALLGWIGDNGDPDNFLGVLLGSAGAVPGSATNISFYRNPKFDELLAAARMETDPTGREELYFEALEIWRHDLPLIPLVHGEQLVVWRSDISGFVAHPTGEIRLGPVLRNEPGP